jgi:glycosyltransferase involved in cell wall biosynthesis
LSYRPRAEGWANDFASDDRSHVSWLSVNLGRLAVPGLKRYSTQLKNVLGDFKPDVIWSCSDAFHAIYGFWLAKRAQTKCVIDLYDNFEAFRASQFPGVLPLFRCAVKEADGVTSFSKRLADHIALAYGRKKPITIIETGVRKDLFRPFDRDDCRERLGLPKTAQIIGTAGALDKSRGIETLFQAFERVAAEHDELHLALAGPRKSGLRIPGGTRVHDLTELPHEEVPLFINALDLAVICYRQSSQGEFSFPQKAYEIMACRVPLIAAAVGTMNELLRNYPDCLYEPDNPASLADAVRGQLRRKVAIDAPIPSWADSANRLADFLAAITGSTALPSKADSDIEAVGLRHGWQ